MKNIISLIIYTIHILIIISILLLPFYPVNILKYIFYIPIIIIIIQIIFNGCIIDKFHSKYISTDDIIKSLFNILNIKYNKKDEQIQIIRIYYLILILIFSFSVMKLYNNCNN